MPTYPRRGQNPGNSEAFRQSAMGLALIAIAL
jgi:hypothetical protein